VYRNGILQALGAGNDYTLVGNTLTLTSALGTDTLVVKYMY
jgi:hypothetical protein